jgi:arginase
MAHLQRFLDAGKEINFMRNIADRSTIRDRSRHLWVSWSGAIKVAAMDFMSNFFIHFPSEKIPHENKLLYEPIESPYAKRVKGVYSMYEKVSKSVSETIKNNFFPVVISGDHSIAGATIAGIKCKPKSKLG